MSGNFDWRTEEDGDWDGYQPVRREKPRQRPWLWLLAILVLVSIAGIVVYSQVQERLAAAELELTDDILSSFRLIRQANDDGDIELFRNLLSGAELEWASAQQELFSRGWLFDLSPYGLAQGPTTTTDVQATISPLLNSAEVTALSSYTQIGQQIDTEEVLLAQTSVFRRGERWVWSPPRDEYWAGEAKRDLNFISISYPKRDEALVLRLMTDLNTLVSQVCTGVVGLECPDNLTVDILFSHDPSVLVEVGERFASGGLFTSLLSRKPTSDRLEMILPTPSLLGLPVDETGYQALLRGYGSHLAVALVNRFVDHECCGGPSRIQAATRKMLADLDLNVWPTIEVAEVFMPAGELEQQLVALICSDGFERRQRLFLMDLKSLDWNEQVVGLDLLAVKSMPNGDGTLLLGQQEAEDGLHSQIWRHSVSGSNLLFDLPVSALEAERVSWEILERQEQLVIEVPDILAGASRYFTIDLNRCGQSECASTLQSVTSRPVWSPDGSQMIVRAYGLLWWQAGENMVPIAEGMAPFWVDDTTYGYVRSVGNEQAVLIVNVGEEENERLVLTTDDLRAVIEPQSFPGRLYIGRILVNPSIDGASQPLWLILTIDVGPDGSMSQARFFAYNPLTEAIQPMPLPGRLLAFNRTPSGQLMAFGGFDDEASQWLISIVNRDLEEIATIALEPGGAADTVPSFSWSHDESWLMILEQGLLTLYHPASGATNKLKPPDASCVQAAWYGTNSTR